MGILSALFGVRSSGVSYVLLTQREVRGWVDRLPSIPDTALWSRELDKVEWAVGAEIGRQIACVAAVGLDGSFWSSGQPTLLVIYTHPNFRNQGLGSGVLAETIRQAEQRGETPLKVQAMNSYLIRAIDALPRDLRNRLKVEDKRGSWGDWAQ